MVAIVAGAIVAVAGAAAILWRAFTAAVEQAVGAKLDSLARRIDEQDEDLAEHNRAVLANLRQIEACVEAVHKQVFPNGGSSLRDRVDELFELVLQS
jgi:demethoxyubiquinone hydroxylase (CLK1/Coq7/Cat5 family)